MGHGKVYLQDGSNKSVYYLGKVTSKDKIIDLRENPIEITNKKFRIIVECSKNFIYVSNGNSVATYTSSEMYSGWKASDNDILLHVFTSNINQNVITKNMVSLSKTSYNYTGKSIKPSVVVKNGNTKLKNNVDYTLKYSNNKKPGVGLITIIGKGIYSGKVQKTFKIVKKAATFKINTEKLTVNVGKKVNIKFEYIGDGDVSAKSVDAKKVKVTLKENQITVKGVSAGSTTITLTASEGKTYKSVTKEINVIINGKTINKQKVQVPRFSNKSYTGKVYTIVTGKGYKLVGTTKATKVGTYKVTAKLLDGYIWDDGTSTDKAITWKIVKANSKISTSDTSIELKRKKSKKVTFTYDGDGKLSIENSDKTIATATLNETNNTITIKGIKAGKTTVTIKATAGKSYKATTQKIDITIKK